jgi:hypothetical protein
VSENFFGTLKTELLYELPLQTRGATRNAAADYIENFYNVRRRHSSLDYVSPVEFELKHPHPGGEEPRSLQAGEPCLLGLTKISTESGQSQSGL